ncbi:hypothetical protein AcW1_007081 [Taiwanofungus camphoratus]|nr:hypothetical protein AcV5_005416 [Antrodia cinnamomea]KAI0925216.1 hypothetical protein AcW2_005892 [Antrodia cinnamomea]KAI0929588.1 hypothetical protein AcV7_005081 [Antrodia cinnamomea]KAI0955525.1 hypothetical protein AcW1_007081 [Antrodia cinnamomea]
MITLLLSILLLNSFFCQTSQTYATLNRTSNRRLHPQARRSVSQCQPFQCTFDPADVSTELNTPFTAISPQESYNFAQDGLQLILERPNGTITTKDGINDRLGDGATINSTFTVLYGKVTFTVSGPLVPGVVTAAILIADQHDEIDVELLGGDPSHWQTNVYAPSPQDKQPLWGVFGEIEDYAHGGSVQGAHEYTVDWNDERIIWSVDGVQVRTLKKDQTQKNGALHFPSHPTRIQLGIWDASAPAGTAQWAKGPIDWSSAPKKMTATFKSVSVECPY